MSYICVICLFAFWTLRVFVVFRFGVFLIHFDKRPPSTCGTDVHSILWWNCCNITAGIDGNLQRVSECERFRGKGLGRVKEKKSEKKNNEITHVIRMFTNLVFRV